MRRNRQVIRMVSLMLGLLRGDRLTVPALAEKHHVRKETIYRDLRALEDLGFPITGDIHGYKSRPRLREGYQAKLMPIPFTIPELAAVCFSATLTEHLTGTALHGALQEAIAKIRSHVPTASLPLLAPRRSLLRLWLLQERLQGLPPARRNPRPPCPDHDGVAALRGDLPVSPPLRAV